MKILCLKSTEMNLVVATGYDPLPDEFQTLYKALCRLEGSIDRIQHMTVLINHESKISEQKFSFQYGWKWEGEDTM